MRGDSAADPSAAAPSSAAVPAPPPWRCAARTAAKSGPPNRPALAAAPAADPAAAAATGATTSAVSTGAAPAPTGSAPAAGPTGAATAPTGDAAAAGVAVTPAGLAPAPLLERTRKQLWDWHFEGNAVFPQLVEKFPNMPRDALERAAARQVRIHPNGVASPGDVNRIASVWGEAIAMAAWEAAHVVRGEDPHQA